MMFKRKDSHSQNCVLGINASILDEPNVIITDGNAAANDVYVGFFSPSPGLQCLDKKMVFARSLIAGRVRGRQMRKMYGLRWKLRGGRRWVSI